MDAVLETSIRPRTGVSSLSNASIKAKGKAPESGCYIYARSAVWDLEGINSQIDICTKLIHESGQRVQVVCADNGVSGNAIGGGLRELLGEARQGRVTHLVVVDRVRLGRSFELLVSILETLQTCGVQVTFADGTPSLRPGEPLRNILFEEWPDSSRQRHARASSRKAPLP
jgi:Resolvase, N terminal domain